MKVLSHKWKDPWIKIVKCKDENCEAELEIELDDLKYCEESQDGHYYSPEYFYVCCEMCDQRIPIVDNEIPPFKKISLKNS